MQQGGRHMHEARLVTLKRVNDILSNAGFDEDYVNQNTLFELEEDLGIGHYRFSGSSKDRSGHILLSTFSKERIKRNIQHILK